VSSNESIREKGFKFLSGQTSRPDVFSVQGNMRSFDCSARLGRIYGGPL
jgi:hypothetical protein